MSVTVAEILDAARSGRAVLSAETVGYLVLGAADRAAHASPATFRIRDIELDERGGVTVPGIRPAAQDQGPALLRGALSELLSCVPAGAAAQLGRVGHSTESATMPRLASELEAALIPVNRAAGRRALARLHRDVSRARAAGVLRPAVAPAATEPVERPIATAAEEPRPFETPVVDLPLAEVCVADSPPRASASPPIEFEPQLETWQPPSVGEGDFGVAPDATPFLGAWPVVVRDVPEHDTDHAPSVVTDEEPIPLADRSDVSEPTRALFATAVPEFTQPILCTPAQRATSTIVGEDSAVFGPTWSSLVEASMQAVVAPTVVIATAAPLVSEPEKVGTLELVAAEPAVLMPVRDAGWIGAILAPTDDEFVDYDDASGDVSLADLLEVAPVAGKSTTASLDEARDCEPSVSPPSAEEPPLVAATHDFCVASSMSLQDGCVPVSVQAERDEEPVAILSSATPDGEDSREDGTAARAEASAPDTGSIVSVGSAESVDADSNGGSAVFEARAEELGVEIDVTYEDDPADAAAEAHDDGGSCELPAEIAEAMPTDDGVPCEAPAEIAEAMPTDDRVAPEPPAEIAEAMPTDDGVPYEVPIEGGSTAGDPDETSFYSPSPGAVEAFEEYAPEDPPGFGADDQDAVLEWVVRDDDDIRVEPSVAAVFSPSDDAAWDEVACLDEDLGEIEWMAPVEPLGETPCEVPIPRYDPREEYPYRAWFAPAWAPTAQPDIDAIDAGWSDEPSPDPVAALEPNRIIEIEAVATMETTALESEGSSAAVDVEPSPFLDGGEVRSTSDESPSPVELAGTLPLPADEPDQNAIDEVEALPVTETPPPYRPRQSDVSELLEGFTVAESRSLRDMSRELKRIAGVAVTPGPPEASTARSGGNGS